MPTAFYRIVLFFCAVAIIKSFIIMTIQEKNKIIASFEGSMIIRPYHQDWNDLMRVVQKIAKIQPKDESIINNGEDSYFDNYYLRAFGMINLETKEFMVRINRFPLHQSPNLIEATYEAVVEFIKSLGRGEK